ncbi:HNH endonuclease [Burkholderia ubonensis]|uniref:HNH endonuclease n=1 Tax=Burkholderia ubonensis TaxID=101571 RepID=UPI000B038548|nr:hypothetical protein [Burkholderia ubonensis]
MRNLPTPKFDAEFYFEKISKEKSEDISNRLCRMKKRIKAAYKNYTDNIDSLESIDPIGINGLREKALLHAYNIPTRTMKSLRDNLLNPDIEDFDECPYCGINEPKTLDHYLPKEKFPEYAIFPPNLIPICNICNSKYKGIKFLSDDGDKLFIHSYFDIFPEFDFIQVNIDVGDKISLTFSSTDDPDNNAFSLLLSNHFTQLELNRRFTRKSSAEISRKRKSLSRFYQSGGHTKVSRALKNIAEELRDSLSGNHWKVALYDGLSASKDFCDQGFLRPVQKAI